MTTVHRMTATVLPGGRIELASPELPEGRTVTVEVIVPDPPAPQPAMGIADFVAAIPPSTRTPEEWEARMREFQEDRDSWER